MRKPWRTTAWSSANKIRVFLFILHNGRGNPGFDGHALVRREDLQFTAGIACPGSHAGHADPASRGLFGGINPFPIVADPEADLVALLVEPHFDACGVGVAGDVGERFLCDAEQVGFRFIGEADGDGGVVVDFDAGPFIETLALPAEAGVESEIVEDSGTEELGELSHVLDGFVDEMEAVFEAAAGLACGEGDEIGFYRRERLAKLVVEFMGEAAGGRFLVFEHEPGDAAELAGLVFEATGEAGGCAYRQDGYD